MGLPAAVISANGRVLTANRFFDAMGHVLPPLAFGGVAITDSSANRLFQDAMTAMEAAEWSSVRSIPLAPASDRAAAIVHVLPLRHAAHDIFSGADILVIANELNRKRTVRTHLSRIFSKTGTNQQSQLIALLKSTQPILS